MCPKKNIKIHLTGNAFQAEKWGGGGIFIIIRSCPFKNPVIGMKIFRTINLTNRDLIMRIKK